ncbi:MAG: 4Fe-4S dicluster domain-containing protein [Candidatus Methylacidiphilales bacterium]|nr:4Fe-4S dicluster domain-containing protein [Candidatus Methylacidiphilales bacterium]
MVRQGILKGMAVTAAHFIRTFTEKDGLDTVQYPEEPATINSHSRNVPFLVYDRPAVEAGQTAAVPASQPDTLETKVEGMRCVACRICEKECPPQCILITQDRDDKGKLEKRPARFEIDISVCMGCQICVELCPFDAIKMNSEFEFATGDRFQGLIQKREQLLRSNTYYQQIHPEEAQVVDEARAAEAAKKEAAAKKAAAAKVAKG